MYMAVDIVDWVPKAICSPLLLYFLLIWTPLQVRGPSVPILANEVETLVYILGLVRTFPNRD